MDSYCFRKKLRKKKDVIRDMINKLPIPGFPGYWITDDGKVFNAIRELKPMKNHDGYKKCSLRFGKVNKQVRIGRIMAFTFLGPPPTPAHVADHINRVRDDDRIDNIRWATPFESTQNRDPEKCRGEANCGGNCRLTSQKVRSIRLLIGNMKIKDIAVRYGVSAGMITHIKKGRKWGWLL